MQKKFWLSALGIAFLLFLGLVLWPSQDEEEEILILAAASLQDVMTDLMQVYEAEHEGKVTLSFASSGTLRKGIEEGAQAHLFISASPQETDRLIEKGHVAQNDVTALLSNQMVLISYLEDKKITSLADVLDSEGPIAIGDPDFVPAGRYAMEIIMNQGLWDSLGERLLYCKDVRQVLAYVATGEVDAGLVYRTDAIREPLVSIREAYEEELFTEILYPLVILPRGKESVLARDVQAFLLGDEARAIFEKYGFFRRGNDL